MTMSGGLSSSLVVRWTEWCSRHGQAIHGPSYRPRPRPWVHRSLLFGLVGALVLLGESIVQGQPYGAGDASPLPSGAQPANPQPAPADQSAQPAPADQSAQPAPAYVPSWQRSGTNAGHPSPKLAPAHEPPPGARRPVFHEHDHGFMRLQIGGGYLHTSESYQGDRLIMSGGALAMAAAFGGAIVKNLIIYGEFVWMVAPDPKVNLNGDSTSTSGISLHLIQFGPGLAYYIEPVNIYVSSTLTLAGVSLSDDKSNASADSDLGLGFSAQLGKEWWVASEYGIGAVLHFQWAKVKEKEIDAWITGWGVALLFSLSHDFTL